MGYKKFAFYFAKSEDIFKYSTESNNQSNCERQLVDAVAKNQTEEVLLIIKKRNN